MDLRVLGTPDEMKAVVQLQEVVWPGIHAVPLHQLLIVSKSGGLVIGAYHKERLIGFVYGFVGFHQINEREARLKHCSHMLAVHPEYRDQGIGFDLKRAQAQLMRRQNLELATWTYDPMESRNAYLNIARLGGMVRTYLENVYGELNDTLNAGLPTDRFEVEWWIDTPRVQKRIADESRLTMKHYQDGGIISINTLKASSSGFLEPERDRMDWLTDPEARPNMTLFEIPVDFQRIRKDAPDLALQWRLYTRTIFSLFFSHHYIITDYQYVAGETPRAYYVLSEENALERITNQKLP